MPGVVTSPRRDAWYYSLLWYRTIKLCLLRFYGSGSHLMGAAIAFYCLICLGPIGIVLASLLQYFLSPGLAGSDAYTQLELIVREMAGGAADHVMEIIRQLSLHPEYLGTVGLGARAVGLVALIWGGLHLFDSIQVSLGRVWVGRPIRHYFLRKLISLLMLATAGLLFVALIVALSLRGAALTRLQHVHAVHLPLPIAHGPLLFVIGVVASAVGYFLLYKFMPARRVDTRAAILGAVFAAIVWQTLSPIFSRMLTYSAQFGAVVGLGWVVIFGWWAFMGAQVLLFGAHLAAAYDHVFISRSPRGEDDTLLDASRRRSAMLYAPDRDAEAERTIQELHLDRPAAACEFTPEGHEIVNGIILAGGRIGHAFAEMVGTDVKGLVPIAGHASIEYVVAAMRQVPGMHKLVLVGDKAAFVHHPVAEQLDGIIDEGPDIWHNLLRAIRFLREDRRILLSTSDIPLLTGEALCAFLKECDPQADLCYPVTQRRPTRSLFGRRLWVFLPLKEGWITHTCNILFDPRLVLHNQEFVERFLSRRKDLWGAAGTVGFGFMMRFFLAWYLPFLRYGMEDIGHHIQAITGARRCQGIVLDYPEIALDIDKPSDVEEIEAFIRREMRQGTWRPSINIED